MVEYDEQTVREAVATSSSMSEAARKTGIAHMTFRRIVKKLGLYAPNQGRKGQTGHRGNSSTKAIPLEEWLKDGTKIGGQKLKHKLIEAGLKKDECEVCGQLPVWNGQPLVLHLDHINGVHTDNRLENVRVICGHCHSQTPTFAGRNHGRLSDQVVSAVC